MAFSRHTILTFPGSQIADIDEGIVNGSLAVREILCSDRIVFGDINANQFQCQLYNCPNLLKKKIQVKQVDNGTTKTVFTGWVTSCKTDDLTGFKNIEAYDYFYKARTKKIKGWWRSFWTGKTQSTLGEMWRAMLTYYNVPYTDTSLLFDSLVVKKKLAKKLRTSYMTTFLNQMCEINMCVPNFDRSGNLEFVKFSGMSSANAIDVRGGYTISQSQFEEDVAVPYDKVELCNEKNNAVQSAGEGTNILSIQNNVFLYGVESDDLQNMANTMLTNMYSIEYITGNITMKLSDLDIKLGDVLRVADKSNTARYCLVCENNYTGSLLVNQSVTSNYEDEPTVEHGVYGNTLQRNDERLEYNLNLKPDNYSGTDIPDADLGKVGDTYFKTGAQITRIPKYTVTYDGLWTGMNDNASPQGAYPFNSDMAKPNEIVWSDSGYYIKVNGTAKWIPYVPGEYHSIWPRPYGDPVITIHSDVGFEAGATYRWHTKIRYNILGAMMDENYCLGFGLCANPRTGGVPNMVNTPGNVYPDGRSFSTAIGENQLLEYSSTFTLLNQLINGNEIYIAIMRHRAMPNYSAEMSNTNEVRIELLEFYLEKIDPDTGEGEGAYTETSDPYIDGIYTKPANTETDSGDSTWQEVDYVHKVDNSEDSGLSYERPTTTAQKVLSLKPNVMRAWFKADPPQVKRSFNQYCVRYTGKPDPNIEISLQSNTGWLNKSIKQDSEGVFTIKSGGTVSSSAIEYCAYKITGLTSGKKYYFNFKCNFKDGTTFGKDFTKGLGLVFNTTGTIDTDDWTGDPDTFNESTKYYSMRRTTAGNFANFNFTATASTMYMCIVVADIQNGQTSSLTLSKMVISQTEKACVRDFYIFDLVSNDWLPYKPWGSGSGDEGGASNLGDLDDVNLDNLANGQTLYYDSATGQWVNGDSYSLPIASANTLGGIKVGDNLSIDENGVLSADATSIEELNDIGDVEITNPSNGQTLVYDSEEEKWINSDGGSSNLEAIDLNQSQYNALTPAEKADLDKMYFITDGNGDGTINNWTISALAYKQLTPVQYEALSSAQKNDGTVYFVSDNATGVYGLKVIDITTAEYEQLTPEQKNNGVPYFVHD